MESSWGERGGENNKGWDLIGNKGLKMMALNGKGKISLLEAACNSMEYIKQNVLRAIT